MACNITAGVGISCAALRRIGGVNKRAYVFNLNDLVGGTGVPPTGYTLDANLYVNSLQFTTYLGLYKYISRKQAHSGGATAQIQGPGGNKFFQHDVILKMFPDDPTDDAIMEAFLVANVAVILEDNNQEFFLYGIRNGLDQQEGVQNTGQESSSDISYSITLVGSEPELPKRVLVTDYGTTKNYLDSLVI
ncbi:MAG: hypothetical protein O2887_10335 [Bacteroidetes bacterium]|nr:hypothetical protein [Bacteroidota bacterium]